jgi:phage tail sheath protein FI
VVLQGDNPRLVARVGGNLVLQNPATPAETTPLTGLDGATVIRPLSAALEVIAPAGAVFATSELAIDASSDRPSLLGLMNPADDLGTAPVTLPAATTLDQLLTAIDAALTADLSDKLNGTIAGDTSPGVASVIVELNNGSDGDAAPGIDEYSGTRLDHQGLEAFEVIEDISIVAAPAAGAEGANEAAAINQALIGHCQRMRYRVAVLDSRRALSIRDVQAQRAGMDSTHAAFYYPWVTVMDPISGARLDLPPSGFVAGIYARNDVERAVWKAPANEVVVGALGFERPINTAQQEILNPLGINCLRSFEGRGHRVWGARTVSSDPEWKYLNVRRYFAYLERSIDRGTQWAVFEPNGERLWANVRRTISDFLLNEFQMGALLGDKPEAAYFVKCDRSTMTQNDLDNGRLVCQIGVAVVKPAEFVIFRIGQWTADAKQ